MKLLWAVGLLLLLTPSGFAQNPTQTNGRLHPELIPDTAAYRAVFLMHSHLPSEQEIQRSELFHARLSFTVADHKLYDRALSDFRRQYDALVQSHDSFVTSGASANLEEMRLQDAAYRQSISMLVGTTRLQLTRELSKDGLSKLSAFVQSEKSHMVVGVRSAQ